MLLLVHIILFCGHHCVITQFNNQHKAKAIPKAKQRKVIKMARTGLDEISTGEFKRKEAAWRDWISKDGKFAPEADRCELKPKDSLLIIKLCDV